jgi:hypothetical protein
LVSAELAPDLAAAVRFAKAEKSPATRKAYATDYRLFCQWCEALAPMPASVETVAAYLAHEAEKPTSWRGTNLRPPLSQ